MRKPKDSKQLVMNSISEESFLKQIIDLAHLYGWKVAHFRSAMKKNGSYMTPVQADGMGFPDLVLVRDRVIFAELKSEKGKLSNTQEEWFITLGTANQEAYCWRPGDWDKIVEILKRQNG